VIVCHCFVIRAADVDSAVAGGACSLRDVRRACGAEDGCGGCNATIEDLLDAHAHRRASATTRSDASASWRSTMRA
jgi:nitrite reductase (NADH) large subunit